MSGFNQIRSSFLEFFKNNDHKIEKSSPLIPYDDPSLLFTSAGMVQFKNYFTGVKKPEYNRISTIQKCLRAGGKHNDLENVGYTARHHTFFEMLGNFSFGDYFKEKAIYLAWNFLTKELKINKERLYITIYHDDVDALDIWRKITGFSDRKIIPIYNNDNFWSAGDTGPCGPCSEIFYDHGDHIFGGLPGTIDADGDRFVEIWNLVFMQFDQKPLNRIDLPKPSIDTGMGLERIVAVMQNVHNNYNTDLFRTLIDNIEDIINVKSTEDNISSFRVISDHLRSASFLIAEGVIPSNEGRGYVLRRIIRRAVRHVNQLNYNSTLLNKLLPTLIDEMEVFYPELKRGENFISEILKQEEEKFKDTLTFGLKLLEKELKTIDNTLPGEVAFKLYDTYGFPLDLTKDILKKKSIKIDESKFDDLMKIQKDKARSSWIGSGENQTDMLWYDLRDKYGSSEFLGYELDQAKANIQAIILDNKQINQISIIESEIYILLNQTPFYGESGGQNGDVGEMYNDNCKIIVKDTKKYLNLIIHHCVLKSGKIIEGDLLTLSIDVDHRNKLRANHTATHLLHKALQDILGDSVKQKGSLVADDRLRFDISYNQPITIEQRQIIENIVNKFIIKNIIVSTNISSIDSAMESGAIALFGEKYEDEVRVISIGDDSLSSVELCGGTHVKSTGEIGLFKIIYEGALSSGIRRIEALTGIKALEYVQNEESILREICKLYKSNKTDIYSLIKSSLIDRKNIEKELSEIKKLLNSNSKFTEISINNINLIYSKLENISSKDLRSIAIDLSNNKKSSIILLFAINDGKISIIVTITDDITNICDARKIVNEISMILGGSGGGGKNNFAQAGGLNIEKIEQSIDHIKSYIEND